MAQKARYAKSRGGKGPYTVPSKKAQTLNCPQRFPRAACSFGFETITVRARTLKQQFTPCQYNNQRTLSPWVAGMEPETIYFDEEVKGHKLLVTSRNIIFKGKQFDTSQVDRLSTLASNTSVNGIPIDATYCVSLACRGEKITIDCAKIAWFGRTQYLRLRSVVVQVIGYKLLNEALRKLVSDEEIVFEHKGSLFEKDSRLIISRSGIEIQQDGILGHKEVIIEWSNLRMQITNGACYLSSYSSGKKITFQLYPMQNNFVFAGVVGHLLEKANYRTLAR
jgi:hypothetical protein